MLNGLIFNFSRVSNFANINLCQLILVELKIKLNSHH